MSRRCCSALCHQYMCEKPVATASSRPQHVQECHATHRLSKFISGSNAPEDSEVSALLYRYLHRIHTCCVTQPRSERQHAEARQGWHVEQLHDVHAP